MEYKFWKLVYEISSQYVFIKIDFWRKFLNLICLPANNGFHSPDDQPKVDFISTQHPQALPCFRMK